MFMGQMEIRICVTYQFYENWKSYYFKEDCQRRQSYCPFGILYRTMVSHMQSFEILKHTNSKHLLGRTARICGEMEWKNNYCSNTLKKILLTGHSQGTLLLNTKACYTEQVGDYQNGNNFRKTKLIVTVKDYYE